MEHKWAMKNKVIIYDRLLEPSQLDEIEVWLTKHHLWSIKDDITYILIGGGHVTIREPSMTDEYSIADIVSPDAPTTTNEKGGSQSDINVRFDLIDAKAMFEMAKVLDHGAKKYGANNWRKIDVDDHLNHLLMHTYAYLAGDRTDDHLSHILCRATFALGVALEDKPRRCDTFMGMDQCVLLFDHIQDHVFEGDEKPWEDNSYTIVGEADTLVDRTVYRPAAFGYVPPRKSPSFEQEYGQDPQIEEKHYTQEEVDEIDRNARAFGWEIGHGAIVVGGTVCSSDDNPFLEADWKEKMFPND